MEDRLSNLRLKRQSLFNSHRQSRWIISDLEIVNCYLIACLEGDTQNLLYSYDRDFDKFKINRKEP